MLAVAGRQAIANHVISLHRASPALIFVFCVCIKWPLHLRAETMPRLFTVTTVREREVNQVPPYLVNGQCSFGIERVRWQVNVRRLTIAPVEEWESLPRLAFQIRARAKM